MKKLETILEIIAFCLLMALVIAYFGIIIQAYEDIF